MANPEKAVLFLVFAFAAQARSQGVVDRRRAQYYFQHGRQTAVLHLTDEPMLETVQAFVIAQLYLLACSRRNAAYLSLGIAITAAKALGLHRVDPDADQNDPKSSQRCALSSFLIAIMGLTC
jgi:hypothetical protein